MKRLLLCDFSRDFVLTLGSCPSQRETISAEQPAPTDFSTVEKAVPDRNQRPAQHRMHRPPDSSTSFGRVERRMATSSSGLTDLQKLLLNVGGQPRGSILTVEKVMSDGPVVDVPCSSGAKGITLPCAAAGSDPVLATGPIP